MKEAITKIFLILLAAAVLTFIAFVIYELFCLLDGITAAFIVIEFTLITGIITVCYFVRKWTRKDTEKGETEKDKR